MIAGDSVLIPFPFYELTDVKLRLAVVIAETKDKYRDLILAAVSTQVPITLSLAEILLEADSINGLVLLS